MTNGAALDLILWRAMLQVLVRRRGFIIPAFIHVGRLYQDNGKAHAEEAMRARRYCGVYIVCPGKFLGGDELNNEAVADVESVLLLGIACIC